MAKARRCKDCPPNSKRPAPHPGPRCATHHREKKRRDKDRAHDLMVQRTYGLEPGEYGKIYEAQGGRCAICRRATGKAKRLAVDHDHSCCPETPACGKCVRGLLCGPCNKFIGHGRDDPAYFYRCAQYLEQGRDLHELGP